MQYIVGGGFQYEQLKKSSRKFSVKMSTAFFSNFNSNSTSINRFSLKYIQIFLSLIKLHNFFFYFHSKSTLINRFSLKYIHFFWTKFTKFEFLKKLHLKTSQDFFLLLKFFEDGTIMYYQCLLT